MGPGHGVPRAAGAGRPRLARGRAAAAHPASNGTARTPRRGWRAGAERRPLRRTPRGATPSARWRSRWRNWATSCASRASPNVSRPTRKLSGSAQRIGDRAAEAVAAFNLGHAYKDLPALRDLDAAERWYRRSLELDDPRDRLGARASASANWDWWPTSASKRPGRPKSQKKSNFGTSMRPPGSTSRRSNSAARRGGRPGDRRTTNWATSTTTRATWNARCTTTTRASATARRRVTSTMRAATASTSPWPWRSGGGSTRRCSTPAPRCATSSRMRAAPRRMEQKTRGLIEEIEGARRGG